ncbi:MAG TPA: prepilin-type N-terminal cleavage/methylation domain-containing protein [Candidatus Peribacteraceae bacterium]|nr:prepilin-type N-terminal cleavage/methylation domain-containing protein [Candidatus Peribacteraceae bacterium]
MRWKGFTLIEVLITMTIIVILSSLILLYLRPGERLLNADNRVRIENKRELRNALVQYHTIHHKFPDGITVEEKQICSYGTANTSCVDLDVLVEEGFLDELPQDELSESPVSGYLVHLELDNDITTIAEHARVKIESDIPLVFVDNLGDNPIWLDTSKAKTWVDVLPPGKQVKLILPIDDSNALTLETDDLDFPPVEEAAFPRKTKPYRDPQTAVDPQPGLISVTTNGIRSCGVLPPFSFIDCDPAGFAINTQDIHTSGKFQITTPELGASNALNAHRWMIENIASELSVRPGSITTSPQFTIMGDQLFFVADTPTGYAKLFRTDGNIITQITDFNSYGDLGAIPLVPQGEGNDLRSNDDAVTIIGMFKNELYFMAIAPGSAPGNPTNNPRLRLYKTDGNIVRQVTDLNLAHDNRVGDYVAQATKYPAALVYDDNLYFSVYTNMTREEVIDPMSPLFGTYLVFPSNPVLVRTDGEKVVQVAEKATPFFVHFAVGNYLYLSNDGMGTDRSGQYRKIPNVLSRLSPNKIESLMQGKDAPGLGDSVIANMFPCKSGYCFLANTWDNPDFPRSQLVALAVGESDLTGIYDGAIYSIYNDGQYLYWTGSEGLYLGFTCPSDPCADLLWTDGQQVMIDSDFSIPISGETVLFDEYLYTNSNDYFHKIKDGQAYQLSFGIESFVGSMQHPQLGEITLGMGFGGVYGIIQAEKSNDAVFAEQTPVGPAAALGSSFYLMTGNGLYRFRLLDD